MYCGHLIPYDNKRYLIQSSSSLRHNQKADMRAIELKVIGVYVSAEKDLQN